MNIIDSIVLTPEAVRAWQKTSRTQLRIMAEHNVNIVKVSTEEAFEKNGELEIRAYAEDSYGARHTVSMLLPKSEWSFAN